MESSEGPVCMKQEAVGRESDQNYLSKVMLNEYSHADAFPMQRIKVFMVRPGHQVPEARVAAFEGKICSRKI